LMGVRGRFGLDELKTPCFPRWQQMAPEDRLRGPLSQVLLPDAPRSSRQQYRLTDRGRDLLSREV